MQVCLKHCCATTIIRDAHSNKKTKKPGPDTIRYQNDSQPIEYQHTSSSITYPDITAFPLAQAKEEGTLENKQESTENRDSKTIL